MKICIVSDSHGKHRQLKLPPADLLIHCGDITMNGELHVLDDFNRWVGEQKHIKYKICIAGNHDWCFYRKPDESKEILSNIEYLQDQQAVIDGFVIYGSPWTPIFGRWAFMKEDTSEVWAELAKINPDILVTHGPPRGILDRNRYGEACGSRGLLEVVQNLEMEMHCFGHIHESYGIDGKFVNAAVLDELYKPVNKPQVIEI